MAGRKTRRKITRQETSVLDYFRFSESYTSLILGVVVVIIASVLLITFVKNSKFGKTPSPAPEISSTKIEPAQEKAPQEGGTYRVKPGDDLWHIAEKAYNDGYKWTLIASANNISEPGTIFTGTVLKLPKAQAQPESIVTQAPTIPSQAPQQPAIVGSSYKVRRGDTLWDIAMKRYNNGYRWVDIARVNNLSNPDLIYADNVLQLPQ